MMMIDRFLSFFLLFPLLSLLLIASDPSLRVIAADPSPFGIYCSTCSPPLVVDIYYGLKVDGNPVHFWNPNGGSNNNNAPGVSQSFEFLNGDQIRWINTDKCLHVKDLSVPNSEVVIMTCDSTRSEQKWVRNGNLIQSKNTNKCMWVENGKAQMGSLLKVSECDQNNQMQQFILQSAIPLPPVFGIYCSTCSPSLLVDVYYGLKVDGNPVHFWNPNGGSNNNNAPGVSQSFEFLNGEQIRWVNTDKCLHVKDLSVPNSEVVSMTCDSSRPEQKWIRYGNLIQSKNTNKCMWVENGKAQAGSLLKVTECDQNNQMQQFIIAQTNPPPASITTTPSPITTTIAPATTTTNAPTTLPLPSVFGIYCAYCFPSLLVDVYYGLKVDGNPVHFWNPNGGTNGNSGPGVSQSFEWINGDQLRWVNTDKCLHVKDLSVPNSAVVSMTCDSTRSEQKWVRIGAFIQVKNNNKCMWIENGKAEMGSLLMVTACDESNQQQRFIIAQSDPLPTGSYAFSENDITPLFSVLITISIIALSIQSNRIY